MSSPWGDDTLPVILGEGRGRYSSLSERGFAAPPDKGPTRKGLTTCMMPDGTLALERFALRMTSVPTQKLYSADDWDQAFIQFLSEKRRTGVS